MLDKRKISIDELLNHFEIQKCTNNENQQINSRKNYKPHIFDVFHNPYTTLKDIESYIFDIDNEAKILLPNLINNKVQKISGCETPGETFKKEFGKKRNIGIVFSGGPAPGGHNVIAGIFDAAKKANPDSKIYGFLMGPDGIIENNTVELTRDIIDEYRNLGGFTMIKTGRTKIDSKEKMDLSKDTCRKLELDALVVVGGDDSNTNAAFLAQEMLEDNIQVIGVPKTIDGDIQIRDIDENVLCAVPFGFHTAARAFATEISRLCTDSSSDVKYWHVCKVMGRVASHLALEVALQTHANITLIGEDLADYIDFHRIEKAEKNGDIDYTAYGMTLRHLSRVICDGIVKRAAAGKNYGVMVIPEGLLEFINEIQLFIIKLNTIIADYNKTHDRIFHSAFPSLEDKLEYLRTLTRRPNDNGIRIWSRRDDDLFNDIPEFFQEGLLTERDTHGNFQFSQVETDRIIMGLVTDYLNFMKEQGIYKIGIQRRDFEKNLHSENLDPEIYGPVLFRNYADGEYLLFEKSIISLKTLNHTLVKNNLLEEDEKTPLSIEIIFKKSIPKFKIQRHFFGYDGRGSDPTAFDCTYTYNLGLTVFSLIANGATGQMAVIKNLETDFSKWEPLGIPIAPLMHLEERKGRLSLVIEKAIVNVKSPAFQIVKGLREKWLSSEPGNDDYRNPGPIILTDDNVDDIPITLKINAIAKELNDQ